MIDKFTGAHAQEIKGLEHNKVSMGFLTTFSNDSCVIWANQGSGCNSVSKLRSIYSKDGNYFTQVKFTADGQAIVTLFKDGDIVQWGLDA